MQSNLSNKEIPQEKLELINKFSKWVMNFEFEFLQDKLFLPIGIELSVVPVVLDTLETSKFGGADEKLLNDMPLAYYDPQEDSIHILIEHTSFKVRKNSEVEQKALLMFLLFHEACHRLLMTMPRLKDRDMELWNIATDYEIHNMYYVYETTMKANHTNSIFNEYLNHIHAFLIDKSNKNQNMNEGLFEKDFLNLIAEEIYQILMDSKEESTTTYTFYSDGSMSSSSSSNSSGKGKGNSQSKQSSKDKTSSEDDGDTNEDDKNEDEDSNSSKKKQKKNDKGNGSQDKTSTGSIKVKVTKYKLPNGKHITTSHVEYSREEMNGNKSPEQQEQDKNNTLLRKTIMENALKESAERAKGNIPGQCSEFLKKMFHIKIDWKKILRNSLQSILEKSDSFSWAKPRISLFGLPNAPYLPSQVADNEKYGTLVVARDESGSMSNEEIAKAAGIIADAKEHYKKIIVLKHDMKITSINEFDEMNEDAKQMLLTRDSCGGTSHKEVFEWIRDYTRKHQDDEDLISCAIFITDMCSDIECYQDIIPPKVPTIYLAPSSVCEAQRSTSKIKGLVIPVEL